MAFITGTASSHTDLWNILLDFLQNNTALVAAGQNWTKVWEHPTTPATELVLKGPGLSGTEEIYVGLRRADEERALGEAEIHIAGMTGIISSAPRYFDHVGVLPRRPRIFLDFSPMQYWMVANGRRFVVVVKISTIYQAMYGGFFLPYGSPTAYPYPLFIGGTTGFDAYSANLITSWRENQQAAYSHFVYPRVSNESTSSDWYDGQAYLLEPSGQWRVGTINEQQTTTKAVPGFLVGPRAFPVYLAADRPVDVKRDSFDYSIADETFGYETLRSMLTSGLNGEMPLTPISLHSANYTPSPDPVAYGVLDGCFSVAGDSNYAENIITIGGVNHLVVPNVMRTTVDEYWALTLE